MSSARTAAASVVLLATVTLAGAAVPPAPAVNEIDQADEKFRITPPK